MPALETLSLTGPYHEDEGLDVLEKCRDLERLSVDEEVLDPFAEGLASIPTGGPRRKTVVLPRLRVVVKLTGQRTLLFHLLATVHTPQATTIELSQCIDDDSGASPLATRLLAADSQTRHPFLSSPRAISLSCWDRDAFHLRIRCGPDKHALLSVDYGMSSNTECPGNANLERNLVAALDFFPVASVDTLEVQGYPDSVAVETWQRAFQTLRSLRTLHIQGRGTFHALSLGLARATTSSLERDGAVCCPSLSEIVVDDRPRLASRFSFEATLALFDLIPGVLRARADAGGARLQKSQLYLQYTDELWGQTSELHDAFVENVNALVGELGYSALVNVLGGSEYNTGQISDTQTEQQ